jgi:hypothetical protein
MSSELVRLAHDVRATDVRLTNDTLTVELDDARTLSVPILWFPRLAKATKTERERWQMLGDGEGIHWPDLDEDIEVVGLLLGWGSSESAASLQRWLDERGAGRKRKKAGS